MYTLYSMDSTKPNYAMTKIKDGTIGELSKLMNSLKAVNKGVLYSIYAGNLLRSSMLNK